MRAQIVIGLKGRSITRLEADRGKVDVEFPTGKALWGSVEAVHNFIIKMILSNEFSSEA